MEVAALPVVECADVSLAVSRNDDAIHAIGDVPFVPIELRQRVRENCLVC